VKRTSTPAISKSGESLLKPKKLKAAPYFDSQQHFSCVLLVNEQTNLPSFTEQQQDEVTSLPVSLQTSFAANTGDASIAAANNPQIACFIISEYTPT
jgi:hypothetical protein